jgi:hypothetical protein
MYVGDPQPRSLQRFSTSTNLTGPVCLLMGSNLIADFDGFSASSVSMNSSESSFISVGFFDAASFSHIRPQ